MSITVVVVTYKQDYDLLDRQLASAEKYLPYEYAYHIVVNDKKKYLQEVYDIVSKYPQRNITVTHRSELADIEDLNIDGWASQQIFKLLVSNIIDSKYYLLLDSKDYYVDHFDHNKYAKDGKLLLPSGSRELWTEEFINYSKNSCQVIGADYQQFVENTIYNHPPFYIQTQYCRDMIDFLKDNDLDLLDLLAHKNPAETQCTEFYLYNAWCVKNNIIGHDVILVDNDLPFGEIKFTYQGRRRKKLAVCGSDDCVLDPVNTGTHFSEMAAAKMNWDLFNYAKISATNSDIALQIHKAIAEDADFVFVVPAKEKAVGDQLNITNSLTALQQAEIPFGIETKRLWSDINSLPKSIDSRGFLTATYQSIEYATSGHPDNLHEYVAGYCVGTISQIWGLKFNA